MEGLPVTKTRGRPKSPATTTLMDALTRKQDAMSRRTARKINELLAAHIPLASAAYAWAAVVRAARTRLGRLPDEVVARLAPAIEDAPRLRAATVELVGAALAELGESDRFGTPPAQELPPEARASARRSTNLAAARAQSAELAVRLMDLRARIVPLDSLRKTTQEDHR
jgi:hypothetical protein